MLALCCFFVTFVDSEKLKYRRLPYGGSSIYEKFAKLIRFFS